MVTLAVVLTGLDYLVDLVLLVFQAVEEVDDFQGVLGFVAAGLDEVLRELAVEDEEVDEVLVDRRC
ncbi:MAG: hypothetical protein U5K37_11690 [Natrialbaceae archaeon]|nr:hypothetical protein [Natrialbaceae archaeon]